MNAEHHTRKAPHARFRDALRSFCRRHKNFVAVVSFVCHAYLLSQPFWHEDPGALEWLMFVAAIPMAGFFWLLTYFDRVVIPRAEKEEQENKITNS